MPIKLRKADIALLQSSLKFIRPAPSTRKNLADMFDAGLLNHGVNQMGDEVFMPTPAGLRALADALDARKRDA